MQRQYSTAPLTLFLPPHFNPPACLNCRASLLPNLSMEGVKTRSAFALWVVSVLGGSYIYLLWKRSSIQSSQGGRRVSPFPRDLSLCISPQLLSLGLLLWQLQQKEGQTLNSHKSEDLWHLPLPSKGIRVEKWQWCPKDFASLLLWNAHTLGSSPLAFQFSREEIHNPFQKRQRTDLLSSSVPPVMFAVADVFQGA